MSTATIIRDRAAVSVHRASATQIRVTGDAVRALVRDTVETSARPDLRDDFDALRSTAEACSQVSLTPGQQAGHEALPAAAEHLFGERDDRYEAIEAELPDALYLTPALALALGRLLIEAATGDSPTPGYVGARRRDAVCGGTR